MQPSKKIINSWSKLKEQGDVNSLAVITDKDPATISRILGGKQGASPEVLLKIKDFFKKRKRAAEQLEDDNN